MDSTNSNIIENELNTTAWDYFTRTEDKLSAVCVTCKKTIKTIGGSTSGLHTHLKTIHNIIIRKYTPKGKETNTKKINQYFSSKVKSLEETVSRMAAKDGLTFRVFTTSEDLRRCLRADGFTDIPTSPNSIRTIVINYSKKVREKIRGEIKSELSKGSRFCITFDEWTSNRNLRYLNVILHVRDSKIWNLGLIRCNGSIDAKKCLNLVEKRIELFGLLMDKHIVSIMTDGASVMTKIGKLSLSHQQLCFAHAIQLSVVDILYKKKSNKTVAAMEVEVEEAIYNQNDASTDIECDSDYEVDEDCEYEIDIVGDKLEDEVEIIDGIQFVIKKVRKIVVMFKRSPLKNEVLQNYVKTDLDPKGLALILDSKPRWNSLVNMLDRFYHLRNCVEKALVDVNPDLKLDQRELKAIFDIVETLKPVQVAVEALCRRDSNLVTADTILSFALEKLYKHGSELSLRLFESLKNRVSERRKEISGVMQYLHSGNIPDLNNDLPELRDIFDQSARRKIETIILNLVKRCHSDETTFEGEKENVEEVEVETTTTAKRRKKSLLQFELDSAIEKVMSSKSTPTCSINSQPEKFLMKIILQEMNLFDNGGNHGLILSKVYDSLLLIKPTSIESERAFSSSGYLCSKIRSSFNDETLDHLCSLRAYFQTK